MNQFSDSLRKNLDPDYVKKFDLSLAPFSSQYSAQLFYENESREILLKKIAHLIDFTKLILFIQGADGLGKTTLIRQRMLQAKASWRTCFVNAKDFTSSESLINKIAVDMGVKFNQAIHLQSLQEQLDSMRQTGFSPVLFIDDVQQLNMSIIPTLSALIQHSPDTQPNLRLVVIGEDIPIELINVIPEENDDSTLKYLPLPPLTAEETVAYIKHRLVAANYQYLEPFNKFIMNNIYLASKGFPFHINHISDQLFERYALDYENNKPLIHLNENTNKILKIIAAFLSALILLILGLSVFSPIDSEVELESFDSRTIELKIPALNDQSVVKIEETKLAPTEPVENNSALKKEAIKIDESIVVARPIEKMVEVKKVEPKRDKPKIEMVKTLEQSRVWIRAQSPKHYTLQLTAGVNKSAIMKFIKRHKIEKNAAINVGIHKGRNWYSVIYKSFKSRNLAQQESKQLSGSLKKIKPWVRSFSVIQKNMK